MNETQAVPFRLCARFRQTIQRIVIGQRKQGHAVVRRAPDKIRGGKQAVRGGRVTVKIDNEHGGKMRKTGEKLKARWYHIRRFHPGISIHSSLIRRARTGAGMAVKRR